MARPIHSNIGIYVNLSSQKRRMSTVHCIQNFGLEPNITPLISKQWIVNSGVSWQLKKSSKVDQSKWYVAAQTYWTTVNNKKYDWGRDRGTRILRVLCFSLYFRQNFWVLNVIILQSYNNSSWIFLDYKWKLSPEYQPLNFINTLQVSFPGL